MSKQRKPTPAPSLPLGGDNAIPAKKLRQCQVCAFQGQPLVFGEMPYHMEWLDIRTIATSGCPGSGKPPREESS